MNPWRRVRGLRWWWQAVIVLLGAPLVLAALYVAGRSIQYLGAEGDAGLFAPSSVHAMVRVRDLDGQLDRLEQTFAWRTLERKILRDPAIRPRLNALLKEAGAPSLDVLADPRGNGPFTRANLLRFAGRDLVAGLAAPESWKTARFCAATRLRWTEYLLTPFAPLVLPGDGELLKVGKIWVAFAGALAIAGNDKALVEEARRGRGRPPQGTRPLEAVVRFDGSPPLQALREEIRQLGLLPHVKIETAKAVRVSADLEGTAARLDAVLEDVEAAYPGQAPPGAFLERAPATTTGVFATPASFRDVYAWAQARIPQGKASNLQQAFETLERGGASEQLLPLLEPGIALITGTDEHEGVLFPAFVLLVKASDTKRALEALTGVVKKIGGKYGESKFDSEVLGEHEVNWIRWPDGAGINEFLMPTWGAVEGGLVFGNNLVFTKAVMSGAGEAWRERRAAKRLKARLKELGFAESPGIAGGVLLPPMLRESLDGVIQYFARVAAVPSDVELRQELEREWAGLGRSKLPEDEKQALFAEARAARIQEYEAGLRRGLRVLDPVKWCAFESAGVPGGISLKLAIGFDSLTER